MPRKYLAILTGIFVLFGLYLSSLYSYLFFHSIVEIFCVLIAFVIFVITWNSKQYIDNNYLSFIGIAFLFIGSFDVFHLLAYKGMGVFRGYDANLPTQLWIAGRYVQSLSFLLAPLFLGRKLKTNIVLLGFTAITLLLLGSIFYWDIFPNCFIEGTGLTLFKILSEYLICLILLASLFLLYRNRQEFNHEVLRLLVISIILTIASEMAFTLYIDVYGFFNLIGHFLKVVAFYLVYRALVETGLKRPYDLLFRNLAQSEKELRQAKEGLEIKVAERTVELRDANEQLQLELTERRRAEQKASQLAAIVQFSDDAIMGKTLEGIIASWNRGAERIYGYRESEVVGQPISILVPPGHEDDVPQILAKIKLGEHIEHYESVRRRKDGQDIYISLTVSPIQDAEGRIIAASTIGRDISERKRADEALRRLNRELRAISDCNEALMRAEDEQTLVNDICRIISEVAGYRMVWVGYPENDDAKTVRPVAWAGVEGGYLATANITWADTERGCGPTGTAIRSGESICVQDFTIDSQAAPWRESALQRGYRSSIALPLKDENANVFGVLNIYSAKPNDFTPDEIRFMEELAGDLAFGIMVLRARSARKQAERNIALLSFALNQVQEAAFLTDEKGCFHFVNEESCRILGYTREELLGLGVADIDSYFPWERWPGHWEELKAKGSLTFETHHKTKDGAIFPVEISTNYFEYDGQGYNLALARDITTRKRWEEALRQSEQKFRLLYDNAPLGYQSLDEDGMIIEVNRTWLDILGYAREEAIGRWIGDFLTPAYVEYFQKNFPCFKETGEIKDLEFEMVRRDGTIITASFNGRIAYDAQGRFLRTHCMFQDISARKRTENIMQARLRLLEFANTHSLHELLTATLDEIEALTGSVIGFYHFLEADQKTLSLQNWSTNTLKNMCTAAAKGSHYDVAQAGVWVDCIYARRPVIHNDYASLPHRKGMPEGHAPVVREAVVPIFRGGLITAIIGVGNKATNYDASDIEIVSHLGDFSWDIVERKQAEEELKRLEWMLSKKHIPAMEGQGNGLDQGYGDLTALNRDGVILKSVGRDVLRSIAADYLDLLGTSSAIYEANGEYAFGIFSSNWCRMLDCASRKLCDTDDNAAALGSGKWLCHESCWTHCSKETIATCAPVDIECSGGIRLYGVPIVAQETVIGSINFGYGDTPKDPVKLRALANAYHLNYKDLLAAANAYDSRPPYIVEMAKSRLHATAKLIGILVERKKAEEALRDSEERFRDLYENAPNAYFSVGVDGLIRRCNRRAGELLGYAVEELVGRPVLELYTDTAQGKVKAAQVLQRLRSKETVRDEQLEMKKADGQPVWISLTVDAVQDVQGLVVESRSMVVDITERKRTQDALRQVNETLRATLDAAPVAIIDLDTEGRVRSLWNPAAERMLGWRRDEVLGQFLPTVPEESKEEFASFREWVRSGKSIIGKDLVRRRKDGSQIEYSLYAAPEYDDKGQVIGNIAVLVDITERKRAEEALRESEGKLAEAQRLAHIGYWDRDLDANRVTLSDEAWRIFGLPPQELILNLDQWHERWLELIHPEDRPRTAQAAADALRGGARYDLEYRVVRPNGEVRSVYSFAEVVRDESGRPRRMFGTMQDITERKRAEEEIRKLNLELEQRVKDRTAQLEAANQELEAFAYSVSHDLRAPLRHVDGFLELLQKRTAAAIDEKSRHYLANVFDSTRRMGTLIDDLLSFSRMGRWEMLKKPVDLKVLVQEVIQEFEPETRGRLIRWQIAELPIVIGDYAMLRIVLVNLISNALKFTQPRPEAEIDIGCLPGREKEIIIYIRDNGVGFDMKYADNLFGVFQRLHRVEEFEGTGIGLANVRRIINRHGGRTWAEGKVNQGATFYFSLP